MDICREGVGQKKLNMELTGRRQGEIQVDELLWRPLEEAAESRRLQNRINVLRKGKVTEQ